MPGQPSTYGLSRGHHEITAWITYSAMELGEGLIIAAFVAALVCLGPVTAETTTESPIERKVTIPPLIVEEASKMIPFRVEESIEVPCVATGEPDPVYKWKMDEKDFDPSGNDGRIAIQPGVGTLIFARPLERDEGIYQCLAQNQVGTALTVKFNLRQAYLEPFQTTGTRIHYPKIGESLTLHCTPPLSFPAPDIFWATISEGERFTPIDLDSRVTMDPIGNLHFVNILPEDHKDGRTYACIVQNQVMRSIQQGEYAKIFPEGQTPVYHTPSLLWSDPMHHVALRSETWRAKCVFAGNPTPKVDWRRINDVMPEGRWRQESYGQELVIENIQFEDAGNYECQGINDDASVPIRKSFILSVEAAPYWINRPMSVDGAEGDVAVFHCEAGGIPEPANFWYINGELTSVLPDDPDRVVEQKKMTFYNLTKEDAQVIQCNATNKHGYMFANAYLNVLTEPPIILDPPLEGQKAAEGQTTELTCRVFGSPKPLVVWTKGSEQLTGGRYKVLESGNLQITDVMLVDAGVYVCTATNKFDTISASGSLIVRRRTEIREPPIDVMVYEGTEAKLTCTATTDPEEVQNLSINWQKDGEFINYDLAQRTFRNEMDNSLTISGTLSLDTGKYTCVASNGIDQDSAGAQLTVQAPPDAPTDVMVICGTQSSNPNLGEKEAEVQWMPGRENYAPILNFIVQFNTSRNPDTWYDVANNISQNNRAITVQMAPYANYTFRVLARNKIGVSDPSLPSTSVCSLLDKQEAPYKNPDNVIGEGDQPNNLVIFWTPMSPLEYNGPDFKYVITWKRADIVDAPENTYTITDPNMWYHVVQDEQETYKPFSIRVKASNAIGECPEPAPWVLGYSGEGEPLAAPSNVQVNKETITDTEAEMSWEQVDLSPDSIQGYFRGYRVQFARTEEWPDNIRESDFIFNQSFQYPRPRMRRQIEMVSVTLTHLPPNSNIRAQVRVLNKYYAGPPSEVVEFATKEGVPGPPASFDVIARGATHMDLAWTEPYEPNGVLTGYQISYQTVISLNLGRMKYREPLTDQSITSLRLTGLSPDTYYRIHLSALTAQGIGEPIFLDMSTLKAETPSPPTFGIVGLNETWMNVSWEPSQSGNPGSVFYVEFRYRGQYQWLKSPDEYVNQWMELVNLESGTVYQVRVVAKNGEKLEAAAPWIEVRTKGQPAFNFQLGTSVWFYGIWIALFIIVTLLILFFIAKKYQDEVFQQKEQEIEENVRGLQAEEFAKQMCMMNEYRESQESLNASDEDEDYAEDEPHLSAVPITKGLGYDVIDGTASPGYNSFDEFGPAEEQNNVSSLHTRKQAPPSPKTAAFQAVQQQNQFDYSYDEPIPVHKNYHSSSSLQTDQLSMHSSRMGEVSFITHRARSGQTSDTFI